MAYFLLNLEKHITNERLLTNQERINLYRHILITSTIFSLTQSLIRFLKHKTHHSFSSQQKTENKNVSLVLRFYMADNNVFRRETNRTAYQLIFVFHFTSLASMH